MIALKLSLGAFFLRIITSQWQRHLIYIVLVISAIANLTESFYIIFMCGDPRNFVVGILSDRCAPTISMAFVAYGQNIVNVSTDIVFAVLPIPFLWDIKMKRGQKWTVGLILTLASA